MYYVLYYFGINFLELSLVSRVECESEDSEKIHEDTKDDSRKFTELPERISRKLCIMYFIITE
jgi:hypothetical protein